MFTIYRYNFWFLWVVLMWALQSAPAFSQTVADGVHTAVTGAEPGTAEGSTGVVPVAFPAGLAPRSFGFSSPLPLPRPVVPQAGLQQTRPGTVEQPVREKMMVSQMNGEVHIKHLQGPRIDPARALLIETGKGNSWCECKLQECTARVWQESQVSVFPDTGVVCLEKGALIVKVDRTSEAKYTVIAGDFMCRVPGGTLRVQRVGSDVKFMVLQGTHMTVYNRKTGEVFNAGQ